MNKQINELDTRSNEEKLEELHQMLVASNIEFRQKMKVLKETYYKDCTDPEVLEAFNRIGL
jgi:hypothetical protein